MKIKFIDKGNIDYSRVEYLLNISKEKHLYTNNGPVKNILEKKLAELLGVEDGKKVLCVNNGTSALTVLISLYEYKVNKKLKWLSPSFTFPSVISNKHNCVLTDINKNTFTLNEEDVLIDSVDGIIITNLFGTMTNIEKWVKICKDKNKILLFDNASSPLSTFKGKKISNYGDGSYGSLHHTKYLGFGEGGFIVMDEKDYDLCTSLTNFGFHKENLSKISSNFKMSDISASFILQHIEKFEVNKYIRIQNKFIEELNNINGVDIFNYSDGVVYGNLPLFFNKKISTEYFIKKGIESNKYYQPIENHKNSIEIFDRIINLPLHTSLTDEEIKYIINIIKQNL